MSLRFLSRKLIKYQLLSSISFGRGEINSNTVNTEALTGRLRTILKDVSKMRVALVNIERLSLILVRKRVRKENYFSADHLDSGTPRD